MSKRLHNSGKPRKTCGVDRNKGTAFTARKDYDPHVNEKFIRTKTGPRHLRTKE